MLGRIIDDNSEDDNTNCDSNHTSNKNGEVLSKGGILEKVIQILQVCIVNGKLIVFSYP